MSKVMMKCGCEANAKRKSGDEWIPSCVIHDCTEQTKEPDLISRRARCCTEASIRPSTDNLAFFEYRGDGSRAATTSCKNCGYAKIAHDKNRIQCTDFRPHGAYEYDTYYCGHSGWD